MLRRFLLACWWLVLGFYLVRHPETAATTVTAILRGLAAIADALARFAAAL